MRAATDNRQRGVGTGKVSRMLQRVLLAALLVFGVVHPAAATTQTTTLVVPIAGTIPSDVQNPAVPSLLQIVSTVETHGTFALPSAVRLSFTVIAEEAAEPPRGPRSIDSRAMWLALGAYPTQPLHLAPIVVGNAAAVSVPLVVSLSFDQATGSLSAAQASFTPPGP